MSSKTIGKVAGFVIGVGLIAAGIFTGGLTTALGTSLIIQGGLMIVTQAIVDLTAPKTPARQAAELSIQLGEQPRAMQVGETATAGSLVDGFNYGGKYGTDWEVLVIRLADHKCASLTGFYVNDEYNAYTGDGGVERYNDKLEIYFRSDTTNDALPSVVTTHGPGWTSADVGESGCDVIVAYKADKPDAKHPVWPGGRPRFLFVIKGVLCYDPRLDDTVDGGAGDHRWEDPDTWEWSENAVICWYKFQRGVFANDDVTDQTKLLVGRGLTAEESPPEYIFAAANLCDEIAASVHPYEIKTDAGSGLGGDFSPNFSRLYQEDSTVLFVWDVLTRTKIYEGPLSGGDIAASNDVLYAKGGGPLTGDLKLWSYNPNGGGEALVVDGFDVFVSGPRYVSGQLMFYPGTGNEVNLGQLSGDSVTAYSPALSYSTTHLFEGPSGSIFSVGFDAVTADNLNIEKLGGSGPSAAFTTTGGSAYGMWNGTNIVVWQDGTLRLIEPVGLTVLDTVAFAVGGAFAKAAFDAVQPGTTTMWIGFTQINLLTLATLRTVDPADWVAEGGLSASVFDPINDAIISQEIATQELTWRFLDRHGSYRVSGPIYASQEFLEVEEMFAAATAGNTITREGSVQLEPGQAKSVVATFTDSDILSASEVNWNQGFLSDSDAEWVNTVVARYVEPDQKWNDHAAPVLRDTDDILLDGGPREASITLRLVRYQAQALRVGEINRRLGRIWGRGSVKLGPRFCELEEGDWVTWTSARHSFTKTFRIDAYQIDAKWQNQLTLREISTAAYADDYDFPTDQSSHPPNPPPPDIGTPEADNWALAAVTLDSPGASVPALEITGSADDDDYVSSIIFEYWLSDGVTDPADNPDAIPWTSAGSRPASTTKVDITSVVGAETYYAAVSYVVDGSTGDRLVLGPVTLAGFGAGIRRADTTFITADDTTRRADLG